MAQLFMIAEMTPSVVTPLAAPRSRVAAGWPGTGVVASAAAVAPAATVGIDRLRPLAGTFAGTFDKQVRPPRGIPR